MWNKIKVIFSYIGTFFVGILTAIFGVFLYNHRKPASGIGTDTGRPEETNRRAEEERRKLEESTRELESGNKRFGEILSEIRKNKQSNEGSDTSV